MAMLDPLSNEAPLPWALNMNVEAGREALRFAREYGGGGARKAALYSEIVRGLADVREPVSRYFPLTEPHYRFSVIWSTPEEGHFTLHLQAHRIIWRGPLIVRVFELRNLQF